MKSPKDKILFELLGVWLIILLLRIGFIYEVISFSLGLGQLNPLMASKKELFDSLNLLQVQLLIVIYLLIPFLVFYLRRKFSSSVFKMNFSSGVILALIFIYIFSPILSTEGPNYQYGLSSRRLLHPLSEVEYLIKKNPGSSDDYRVHSRDLVYFDYISFTGDSVEIREGAKTEKYAKSDLYSEDGQYVFSKRFLLGSDEFGRDILTRLMYGSRISLTVGFLSVLISTLLGLSLGFIAGYYGGWLNTIISRFTDTMVAIPSIFLVLLVLAMFGNSFVSVILVLGFAGWFSLFKIVKGEVLSLKQKDYILAAGKLGLSKKELLLREMLPVMAAQVLTNILIQFTNAVLTESTLSYLGLGVGIENPSWGSMIQSGQEYIYISWWMILIPGIVLTLTIFSFNRLANRVRVKLNPRLNS